MYLLDTNVISELRRGKRHPSEAVRRWAAERPLVDLYLSPVTVLELEIGVRRMERRDGTQGAVLRAWCSGVLREFEGRVLAFGTVTAQRYAELHVPNASSFRNSMIAALALEHRLTVVTRNFADFAGTGVQVVNPWD